MNARFLLPALLPLALAACATPGSKPDQIIASASLATPTGLSAGVATIELVGGTPTLKLAASNISPGPHGVHIHAVGKCEAPGFTSAGGHLNPHGKQHGSQNPAGAHFGDLPNLVAASTGSGELIAPLTGSADAVQALLFDADGSAVVIHATADDYRTDPTGNSGARIACGVFVRP